MSNLHEAKNYGRIGIAKRYMYTRNSLIEKLAAYTSISRDACVLKNIRKGAVGLLPLTANIYSFTY